MRQFKSTQRSLFIGDTVGGTGLSTETDCLPGQSVGLSPNSNMLQSLHNSACTIVVVIDSDGCLIWTPSVGQSSSIFLLCSQKERERERAFKQYSFQFNSAVLLHKYGAAKRRRVLSKRSSVCRVSIPACNLIYSLSMPGVVIKPADN